MPTVLDKFPKHRPALPSEYAKIYEQHYLSNRRGRYKTTSLSQKLEAWMHRKVAADLAVGGNPATLEVGAGTLNQLAYEPAVERYDIVEPFRALFDGSAHLKRVRHTYDDISEAYQSAPYDRITSVAVFEHIVDLPIVVAHAALLLAPDGHLRTAIPNEGTFLWRLGTMVTGYEFRMRYGLDYEVLMRFEHLNGAAEIEDVLKEFFGRMRCSVLGVSRGIAFYRFYDCSSPLKAKADQYLNLRGLPHGIA